MAISTRDFFIAGLPFESSSAFVIRPLISLSRTSIDLTTVLVYESIKGVRAAALSAHLH